MGRGAGLALLLSILALLSALPFSTPTLHADAVRSIEVSVPMVVSGTPLTVKVDANLPGNTRGRVATLLLDGNRVDEITIRHGENELSFDEIRPRSGAHSVSLVSGTLRAETEFRLLPGWMSVAPPVLAIALALIFRDVLIALFLGVFSGAFILSGWDPFTAFARSADQYILEAVADSSHASIMVFTCFLGGMVGLVTKSGGTHGVVRLLTPYATSARRGQVSTWFMGLMVFFDDYANTLIVGPTMRPITDKLRISREKLAYLVDSTAAPVVCLFPISTWVGFEIGLISDAFANLGIEADAYTTFVASIPYRFYPIFALVFVFTIAFSGYDFGPMRRAERRARKTGQVLEKGSRPIADYSNADVAPPEGAPHRAINAILPIVTVIVMTIVGIYVTGAQGTADAGVVRGDQSFGEWMRVLLSNADSYKALLWSSLSGMLMAFGLAVGQRILKVVDAVGSMVAGIKAMFLALMVLTLAWSLAGVCENLDTAQYLVGLTQQSLSPVFLPALTFVLAAAVAFATGSSWGTMGILEPLVIPIAHQLLMGSGHDAASPIYSAVMLSTIASVLSGSVWGDHCSPISDTTILSSMATGCDHIAHVRTQLPYALAIGGVAIALGSIPTALGLAPWISILVGIGLLVGGVVLYGRKIGRVEDEIDPPNPEDHSEGSAEDPVEDAEKEDGGTAAVDDQAPPEAEATKT